jgi:hypothetical protein
MMPSGSPSDLLAHTAELRHGAKAIHKRLVRGIIAHHAQRPRRPAPLPGQNAFVMYIHRGTHSLTYTHTTHYTRTLVHTETICQSLTLSLSLSLFMSHMVKKLSMD